ncbi:MAG: F420-0--gamma-glutamyl ligase [Clostridiales bacterium]|nr:F420-0--gamma-glutamyl ligase [Clostridiales bacterium]
MSKTVGTIARGIRAPIIREGDDVALITAESVIAASIEEGFEFHDRDVVAVTEAVVARAQGNYATIDDIACDVRAKFPLGHIGVIFPILSRNRFSICLSGIARGAKKITLMLSYPSDEVGNHLVSLDQLDEAGVEPGRQVLSLAEFRAIFGKVEHTFTGVDYVELYKNLIEAEGCEAEIIFANNARDILNYTKDVLCCDVHSRQRTKRILKAAGADLVLGLDDIMTKPVNGSGYNKDYGLLGSNKATDDKVKLFPRDCEDFIARLQAHLISGTGKHIECMIYGDGAFKDPVGKIWELADPVVSPAYTPGLEGTPNELKLKYLADNDYKNLAGDELKEAIRKMIKTKDDSLKGTAMTLGTTPRRLTDLIGSLSDLTSGSGDKGTPIVLIQGYFSNYADE